MSCALFAAISGSSIVTMLAVGTMMFPALIAAGYPRSFSIGLICAGGTLGIIIPPSIPMILFGIMTETSITKLFIAGVLPGLLLAALLGVYAFWTNRDRRGQAWSAREILQALREGLPALALPVLLLGGIYSGHFTPTEAAAAALVYALAIEGLVYREVSLKDFYGIVTETAVTLGMLLPLVAFATSLSVVLDYERVPQALVAWVQTWIHDRSSFLLAANLLLLVAGCLMEVGSAIVILAPLLMPMAKVYGVDPVHFGIIMTVNLEIGYITPPVGLNLFVAMAAFKAGFVEVSKAALPFVLVMLLGLFIVSSWPALTLALLR
jgi:C4-dicarboxylate transporter DctM subunit